MDPSGSLTQCLVALKAGDSYAGHALWERYYDRLVGLARKKLGGAPRRTADEEDVVLSAFDSFCRGAAEGRFPRLDDRNDLWQVLMMITARKAANQLKHQTRQKRGGGLVRGESAFIRAGGDEDWGAIEQVMGDEPTPEFALAVAESCQAMLAKLGDEALVRVALLKMEGHTNREIAERFGCKERTIERKLNIIREIWSAKD